MTTSLRGGIKRTGVGRILFWRGGGVWIGHADSPTDIHSHHAIQITLVLSKSVLRLKSPDEEWHSYTAAIVPANYPHAFDASGEIVAVVFVEPESTAGQVIRERYCAGIEQLCDTTIVAEISALATAYAENLSDDELIKCAGSVIAGVATTSSSPKIIMDKRIVKAIDIMHSRIGQSITLAEIADAVFLSPERFRHLFIEQTGIRFRPYILWLRLGVSVSAYAAGESLTEASFAGGFSDAAHFSRTFKRMFGVVPISIHPQ
jgi:AraC family transcriptional regulator